MHIYRNNSETENPEKTIKTEVRSQGEVGLIFLDLGVWLHASITKRGFSQKRLEIVFLARINIPNYYPEQKI